MTKQNKIERGNKMDEEKKRIIKNNIRRRTHKQINAIMVAMQKCNGWVYEWEFKAWETEGHEWTKNTKASFLSMILSRQNKRMISLALML